MGFAEHPPLETHHREVLPKGTASFLAGLVAGLNLQDTDIESPGLAGQLATEVDALRRVVFVESDPAALKRDQRLATAAGLEIEEERAVEEEVALFRKQQRETREVGLARVDLGLREVGVYGEIRSQTRGDVVEQIDADLRRVPVLGIVPTGERL